MKEKIEQWAYGELGTTIWEKKYRQNNETFSEWLDRLSIGHKEVRQLILERKFLPAGRILSNLNNKSQRKVTYSNCYVIAPPEDNLVSIFDCAGKLAQTYAYGGGCGVDLSELRPNGSVVNNASKTSSGSVSFMDLYSQVTNTISQNGRRGALMISLDVRHPDAGEFVNSKANTDKINYANISIRVNNDFMTAVEKDLDFIQKYPCDMVVDAKEAKKMDYDILYPYNDGYIKKIRAKQLFQTLVHNNWAFAEPGILYWDKIEQYNMLNNNKKFKYSGVNPCAEEPLPSGGSCLLGSINLAEFVVNHQVRFDNLAMAVRAVVCYLNDVLDLGLPLHPLKEQQESVKKWRQIGLGTMGLADMLIKLGITYGSKESIAVIEEVYACIAKTAVETSLELAKEKGAFPEFSPNLTESSFIKNLNLPASTIQEIKKYGLRNSQLLTCAPTGSIATMLGVSTGVEPIFAMSYTRTTKSLKGKEEDFQVFTPIAEQFKAEHPNQPLPDYFVDSSQINYNDRIDIQATLQKYIDASISSTINLPEETTEEDVYNIYFNAWKKGLKGVTIFRSGCERDAILTVGKKAVNTCMFDSIIPPTRDDLGDVLVGYSFKKKTACGSLYITINVDSSGHIVEIFTNTSKHGTCQANLNGQTRMTSLALRAGIKVDEVIDQLQGIRCSSCVRAKAKGEKIDGISCPDILGTCIETLQHMVDGHNPFIGRTPLQPIETTHTDNGLECPSCHKKTLQAEGGCFICTSCGYSKCE